jgi:hypothetical protein
MPQYTCIYPCQFKGDVVRKGTVISIPDAEIHLPVNARLHSARNFLRLDAPAIASPVAAVDGGTPPPPPATNETPRQRLLRRALELGCTVPSKATIPEIEALIAAAADPAGHAMP